MRLSRHDWQKTIWKIVTNPAIEVVATLVVVLVATWYLILTDAVQPGVNVPPVLFGRK
jgi:hypothetical protein